MGQRTGRPKYGNEKFFNRPVKETFLTLDKPVIGLAINWISMGRGGLPIVRDNAVAWITAHGLRASIDINNNGSK